MRWLVRSLLVVGVLAVGAVLAGRWYLQTYDEREPSRVAFAQQCAQCHGDLLQGTAEGPDLMAARLQHGDSVAALMDSIVSRHPQFPAAESQSPSQTKSLALYIIERRQQLPSIAASHSYQLPEGVVSSTHHNFRVERVATLRSGPYAMAPLPDGRILVSEKVRGLTLIDPDEGDTLVTGTPRVWREALHVRGSYVGLGQMLDVQLHPDYAENGWVYLSHTDRCQLDCGSAWPVSMVRVIRGQLENGRWVNTEVIWSVPKSHYTVVPDGVAAGRLAFDDSNYLFVTVGGKR